MGGCAEKRIIDTDHQIDARVATAFRLISHLRDRRAFVAGERAWLVYRHSSCQADASPYEGGTVHPLIYAVCVESRNRAHASELAALLRDLHAR
jgi:uncharacterized protein YecT (DUF1311 family)